MVVMLIRPCKREIRYCMTIVTLINVPVAICLYHNTAGSRSEGDKQGEVPDTTSTPDANEKKPEEDGIILLAIFLE